MHDISTEHIVDVDLSLASDKKNRMTENIVYRSSGQGLPFHFQHGLGSNLEQPQGLLKDLTTVQLISLDCQGHGAAELPANRAPSFAYYAEAVIRLMDNLGLSQAIFGGISMGAGISTYIALHYPERVRALVLICPAWLDQGNPENLRILNTAADYIEHDQGKEQFKLLPDFKLIEASVPNAALSVLGVFADTQRTEISTVLRAMVQDRPFENIQSLQGINVPCLVIGNEDDPLHPFEMAMEMHKHIPNSQLEKVTSRYIDDAQHRQIVYQTISKFIDNL